MDKNDWVAKLTSRKFWMALVGLVSGLLLAFKVDEGTVTEISGIIMAAASVVAYIIGEGLADAAGAKAGAYADAYVEALKDKPPEDEDDGK